MPADRVAREGDRLLADVADLGGCVFLVEAMPLARLGGAQHEEPAEPQILHVGHAGPLATRAGELGELELVTVDDALIDRARLLMRRDLADDVIVVAVPDVAASELLDEPGHGRGFTPVVHIFTYNFLAPLRSIERTSAERFMGTLQAAEPSGQRPSPQPRESPP